MGAPPSGRGDLTMVLVHVRPQHLDDAAGRVGAT